MKPRNVKEAERRRLAMRMMKIAHQMANAPRALATPDEQGNERYVVPCMYPAWQDIRNTLFNGSQALMSTCKKGGHYCAECGEETLVGQVVCSKCMLESKQDTADA